MVSVGEEFERRVGIPASVLNVIVVYFLIASCGVLGVPFAVQLGSGRSARCGREWALG